MAGTESKNYYELLGLTPEASKEEIKASYKEIARIFHPDSHFYDEILASAGIAAPSPAAPAPGLDDATFKIITAAYNVLVNDVSRAAYDRTLPRNIKDWDDDADSRFGEQLRGSRRADGGREMRRGKAFGVFGSIEDPPSAFDNPEYVRPVSEMIKLQRRGPFSWFWRLLGKR